MKTEQEYLREISKHTKMIWFALCVIAGLMIGSVLKGQFRETPAPAIYLAHTPWDMGFGLRGDYHITHWTGVYGSATYGQGYLYKWSGLGKHVKATIGTLIPYKDWKGNQHDFTVGLNYHWVSGQVEESDVFKDDPQFHKSFSFELGFTIKAPRFTLAFRTDILRWEPGIDIGIPLNFKDRNTATTKRPKRPN